MSSQTLIVNEATAITEVLKLLGNKLFGLRISLSGVGITNESTEKSVPYPLTSKARRVDKAEPITDEDRKLISDCCRIEKSLNRILNEVKTKRTYNSLLEIIQEYQDIDVTYRTHKKTLGIKMKQIQESKDSLASLQDQVRLREKHMTTKSSDQPESQSDANSFDMEFLQQLMDYKKIEKQNYYEYKEKELSEKIDWYEKEKELQKCADVQTISFWLLKYNVLTKELDEMLKKMFDDRAQRQRDINVVKKFRKLNLEKIARLKKTIAEREAFIEKYNTEKELLRQKELEEFRKNCAATLIQAMWRGTMVRKHLGPYKVEKPKKAKGKKGKGKKK